MEVLLKPMPIAIDVAIRIATVKITHQRLPNIGPQRLKILAEPALQSINLRSKLFRSRSPFQSELTVTTKPSVLCEATKAERTRVSFHCIVGNRERQNGRNLVTSSSPRLAATSNDPVVCKALFRRPRIRFPFAAADEVVLIANGASHAT